MANYTNRHVEVMTVGLVTVDSERVHIEGTGSVFSFVPDPGTPTLQVGDDIVVETTRGSLVTGVQFRGQWIMRKSDEDLEADHQRFREDFARHNRERLEQRRDEWRARQEALPDWIRARLEYFHARGGENFEVNGWGYELIIAELAVLYRESGGEDSPSVREFAALHGTSGNQHAVAKMLAGTPEGVSVEGTRSALAVLGTDPFYEEK